VDHVLLAEQFFRRDLERLAEAARLGRSMHIRHTFHDLDIGLPFVPRAFMPALELPLTLATFFLPASALNVLTASRLFPMRHPTVANPQPARSADTLRAQLVDAGRQTVEILGLLSPAIAVRITVSHPMLGTRNIPELIQFMIQHERRHQRQIVDLKASLASRAAAVQTGARA
jgi:hypothetical protein